MAERIPSPQVLELVAVFTQNAQQLQNVHHWHLTSPIYNASTLEGMADFYIDWWKSHMQAEVSSSVQLIRVDVTDLSTPTGLAISRVTGLPAAGGVNDPGMPNNVTIAVKWLTALRGRSYRGRTYHVGLTKGVCIGNVIETGALGRLLTAYNALTDDPGILELTQMCVLSEVHNNAPRAEGVWTMITGCAIDPNLDSQRRRLNGRGS